MAALGLHPDPKTSWLDRTYQSSKREEGPGIGRLPTPLVGTEAPKTAELTSEPSLAQSFREFVATKFIALPTKFPRGVPQADLEPVAVECDGRGYLPNSDFLPSRVCKAINEYDKDHPASQIKSFSDLVAVLKSVPTKSGSIKKRQKSSTQRVSRQFRLWLSENERDYLEQLRKTSP
jgi:hypothetical protein